MAPIYGIEGKRFSCIYASLWKQIDWSYLYTKLHHTNIPLYIIVSTFLICPIHSFSDPIIYMCKTYFLVNICLVIMRKILAKNRDYLRIISNNQYWTVTLFRHTPLIILYEKIVNDALTLRVDQNVVLIINLWSFLPKIPALFYWLNWCIYYVFMGSIVLLWMKYELPTQFIHK